MRRLHFCMSENVSKYTIILDILALNAVLHRKMGVVGVIWAKGNTI